MVDEKTSADQRDSGRRLGERITDITFWRNELSTELEKMIGESNLLQDTRRAVEKAYQDTEVPFHIAQECLYHREHRQGKSGLPAAGYLVQPSVEKALNNH